MSKIRAFGRNRGIIALAALCMALILWGCAVSGAESSDTSDQAYNPEQNAAYAESGDVSEQSGIPEAGAAGAEGTELSEQTYSTETEVVYVEGEAADFWNLTGPFETQTLQSFQVPVPEGWSVQMSWKKDRMRAFDEEQKHMLQATVMELNGAFFAQETWGELYSQLLGELGADLYLPVTVGESELGMLFPEALEIEGETTMDHRLRLVYGNGTKLLLLDILSTAEPLWPDSVTEALPLLKYELAEGEAVYADYQLTVQAPEDKTEFSAGEKVKFTAAFANTDTVRSGKNNNGVSWYVMTRDESAGEYFSINQYGMVTISAELQEPAEFAVVAMSDTAGTQGYLELTALPQIQEMSLDQTELTLYLGQTETAELQLTVAPETATRQVEWLSSARGVVTVEPGEDGKATLQAVKPGEATITARDEVSGKRAKVTVTVIRPVTEVVITGPEELKARHKGFYRATLTPKDATNRRVLWSVDVEEDIAVIEKDGSLQIKKNAEPGTVITIYCEALGSSDVLKGEFKVTVTE